MSNKTYTIEEMFLSKYACFSKDTRGRDREEQEDRFRTHFQRDRDRIIHSKAFRRLKNKTQVFLRPEGDHFRTRMTHTLDVAQIARTISRILNLNEDLTEAIALGHDLGHTPYGHAGEHALSKLTGGWFSHEKQGVRVVELLEKEGEGLNLTVEVRDGIKNHNSSGNPMTLEGHVVHFSDRIAYLNHDIDDAVRAHVIKFEDIPKDIINVLGETHSGRINRMITSIYDESYGKNQIAMTDEVQKKTDELRAWMFENVYFSKIKRHEEEKVELLFEMLFNYFMKSPEKLPEFYVSLLDGYEKQIVVADYLSTMTDSFILTEFSRAFVPAEMV